MVQAAIVSEGSGGRDGVRQPILKVHAIVNLRAGTALGLQAETIRTVVETAYATKGQQVSVECVPPEEVERAISEAVSGSIDVLIVGGGDGTIRTAARYLIGTGTALGILPLGTINRLAKDLEIPLRLEDAAAYLADATPTRIDVAKVNDSIFLCNSVMGTTLRYSVTRARLRGRPVLERIPKYLATIRNILSSRRTISIVVDNGDERLAIRALSVVVTNNGYDETTSWLRRPKLDGGKLTMYISKHRSGWGLVKALARAVIGRWHGDPEMAKLTGSSFVIHAKSRRKRLANDGEIGKFDTPLKYEVMPRALTVLTRDGRAMPKN